MTISLSFGLWGLDAEATIDYTPGCAGQYSGPPESCYPEEAPEIDVLELTIEGHDALFLMKSMKDEDVLDAICMTLENMKSEKDYPE